MSAIDAYLTMCGTAANGLRQAGAFGEPEQWLFDWDRPYTRDEWLELVPTIGGHSRIPPAKLQELLTGIGPPSTRWGAVSPRTTPRWRSRRRGQCRDQSVGPGFRG